MTNYDFTTVLDRTGKDSWAMDRMPSGLDDIKIRDGFSKIPMWVADMNFVCAPSVMDAIRKRLEMPNFGYFPNSDRYYDAIIDWHTKYKKAKGLTRQNIGYENGVLGGVSSAVRCFAKPGDKVLVHSPLYVGFTHVFEDIDNTLVHSPLVKDRDGVWRMDYEDMDRKIRENNIKVAIFCSPHNPTGRVWTEEELEKAMDVYRRNDCIVISDEIWSDIIMPGFTHTPTQSINEDARSRTIAFYAPSKTFSIAGLIGSYHIIYNPELKRRLDAFEAQSHYNDLNVLSMHALTGAFSDEGRAWADQMTDVIRDNLETATEYFNRTLGLSMARPEGTYLLFVDLRPWCEKHGISTSDTVRKACEVGVIWQDGKDFNAEGFVRLNMALPKSLVAEALDRLSRYVFTEN